MRLGLEIKNPWNFTADFNSSAQRADTISDKNAICTLIRCFLNKVRTFFEENPNFET